MGDSKLSGKYRTSGWGRRTQHRIELVGGNFRSLFLHSSSSNGSRDAIDVVVVVVVAVAA